MNMIDLIFKELDDQLELIRALPPHPYRLKFSDCTDKLPIGETGISGQQIHRRGLAYPFLLKIAKQTTAEERSIILEMLREKYKEEIFI